MFSIFVRDFVANVNWCRSQWRLAAGIWQLWFVVTWHQLNHLMYKGLFLTAVVCRNVAPNELFDVYKFVHLMKIFVLVKLSGQHWYKHYMGCWEDDTYLTKITTDHGSMWFFCQDQNITDAYTYGVWIEMD